MNHLKIGRFVLGIVLAFTFYFSSPASICLAKRRNVVRYGTVKLQTFPAGLPMALDGKSFGETIAPYRELNLEPGLHTIEISLPNGKRWIREIEVAAGRIKCLTVNYRPTPLATRSYCPFPISVSGPTSVNEGELITYTAEASYEGTSKLNYRWTVAPASVRILSGSGTPTITIDSTGFANQQITATATIDDGSGEDACRHSAQASTSLLKVPPRENPARQIDVCYSCSYDDLKARLDNLAVELQSDPSSTAQIIAYGGRDSRRGQADRLGARAKDYLSANRRIDSSRIAVVNGGFREEDCVELWLVPSGATAPHPTPTVRAGDVNAAPQPIRRR